MTNIIILTLHKEVAEETVLALRGHIDQLNDALELCSAAGVNEKTLHGIVDAVRASEEGLRELEGKLEKP